MQGVASDTASFKPKAYHLDLYAGDGAALRLTVTNGSPSTPLPLTGQVAAQIRKDRQSGSVLASFNADLTEGAEGIVLLTLTGEQTQELMNDARPKDGVFIGQWDCQWHPDGSQPITILSGNVRCDPDVTREDG